MAKRNSHMQTGKLPLAVRSKYRGHHFLHNHYLCPNEKSYRVGHSLCAPKIFTAAQWYWPKSIGYFLCRQKCRVPHLQPSIPLVLAVLQNQPAPQCTLRQLPQ